MHSNTHSSLLFIAIYKIKTSDRPKCLAFEVVHVCHARFLLCVAATIRAGQKSQDVIRIFVCWLGCRHFIALIISWRREIWSLLNHWNVWLGDSFQPKHTSYVSTSENIIWDEKILLRIHIYGTIKTCVGIVFWGFSWVQNDGGGSYFFGCHSKNHPVCASFCVVTHTSPN